MDKVIQKVLIEAWVEGLVESPCLHDWIPTKHGHICIHCQVEVNNQVKEAYDGQLRTGNHPKI